MSAEAVLTSFYSDPVSLENALTLTDAAGRSRLAACIRALRLHGIEHSQIDVDEFAVFRHDGVAGAIERFIRGNPWDALPLERITVNQYAALETCRGDLAQIRGRLEDHRERMAHFATRFNMDIHVHIFVQSLDAAQAAGIAEFARSDAVDSIGFYYDFSRAGAESAADLKGELAQFCAQDPARNPKIKLGNFPFCFLPASQFKFLYREALGELKGQIGAQRDLLAALRSRPTPYHDACRECRCRMPCYAYTRIGDFPECGSLADPRRERTVAFAGGSLAPEDRAGDRDIVWAAPAEQGDMLAAVLEGFENLLLMDGYFYSKFPCTTFEVMLALEAGVNVFGASSIGALRGVELDRYGMHAVGQVYEYLKDREVKPYHVVAQTYDDRDRPLTAPLIQIVHLLAGALGEGVLSREEHDAMGALADGIHFTVLSLDHFVRQVRSDPALAEAAKRLEAFLRGRGGAQFDVKRQDALRLLQSYRAVLAGRPPGHVSRAARAAAEQDLEILGARYPGGHNLALPADWKAHATERAAEASPSRDRRGVAAEETCRRAGAFFKGLHLVVADTTRYDPAGSFILSTFFVPFYFLEYSPSSATGNGSVYREALASSYMELVERLSACGLRVEGLPRSALASEPFPAEWVPQFYNWGAAAAVKQRAVDSHGYVAVTDLAAGGEVFVPAASVLFKYSGTDGYAAGNSLPEAVLYGLYEIIERDTCQMHLVDPACRAALPSFQIEASRVAGERSLALLAQVREKGCDVALFSLPNLCGLPCVMCHVYDRNRRIQCHGGIAVRADFQAAVHAALHEAYMQYITYFVGTRDDYHALAATKRARVAYENAQRLFFDGPAAGGAPPPGLAFESVGAELEHVLARTVNAGAEHVLVADLSPSPGYGVHCVKVIVPTFELWFCPRYRPSPFFEGRARRTRALFLRDAPNPP